MLPPGSPIASPTFIDVTPPGLVSGEYVTIHAGQLGYDPKSLRVKVRGQVIDMTLTAERIASDPPPAIRCLRVDIVALTAGAHPLNLYLSEAGSSLPPTLIEKSVVGVLTAPSTQAGVPDPTWPGCERLPNSLMFDVVPTTQGRTYVVGSEADAQGLEDPFVIRCLEEGGLDPAFAGGQVRIHVPSSISFKPRTAVLDGAGRVVVAGEVAQEIAGNKVSGVGVVRVDPDGTPDASFGLLAGMFAKVAGPPIVTVVVLQPDGRLIVGGRESEPVITGPEQTTRPLLARFLGDGTLDPTFGTGGIARLFASAGGVSSLVPLGDGRWLVGGTYVAGAKPSRDSRLAVTRMNHDGTLDTTFATDGIAVLDAWPFAIASDGGSVKLLSNGRIVVAGTYDQRGVVIARFTSDGRLDPSFVYGGWTSVGVPASLAQLIVQADGRLVVAASHHALGNMLLRFLSDGTPDTEFGFGGRTSIIDPGVWVRAALQADGKLMVLPSSSMLRRHTMAGPSTITTLRASESIVASGTPVLLTATVTPGIDMDGAVAFADVFPIVGCDRVRLLSGVATCPYIAPDSGQRNLTAAYFRTLGNRDFYTSASGEVPVIANLTGTLSAVEFYHPRYNHYFVTTSGAEAAALDAGKPSGWRRTGFLFRVPTLETAESSPVCRFWTGQTFAPVSSHFYTPYISECAGLRNNPDWSYEGHEFGLYLIDASAMCPAGATPLYRFYNNGQGGAPNHRYSTLASMSSYMTERGWVKEGSGPNSIFACAR